MTEEKAITYQDAMASCIKYFNGDELAATAVVSKYLMRSKTGEYLERNPDDYMRGRISHEFARVEERFPNPMSAEEIYQALQGHKYVVCQGSPTFGIGNTNQVVSLANCFAIGQPYDSYGGICLKDQEMAQIMKRRGGVGIDISTIRPSGTRVRNSARTSDGIRVFMERYSNTTKEVAQGGRRGALMMGIDCRHPDIDVFINIKRDLNKVTGANISVKWSDDFLQAVVDDKPFTLRFPVDVPIEKATVTRIVKARDIWNQFIQAAWESGEPGCLFWDRIINQSISDCYADVGFKTIITNPCGELPLSAYGACILFTLNLTGFVVDAFKAKARIDWKLFDKHVRIGLRLADDMIELEMEKVKQILDKIDSDPEPTIIKRTERELWEGILRNYEKGRRVGLGVTGLADMLAMLNVKYGSDESLQVVDKLFATLQITIYDEDAELAKDRGHFPCWDWEKEKDNHYIVQLPVDVRDKIEKYGRRNIGCMTIAPTGTTSLLTQTSSGVEPVFRVAYTRNKKLTPDEEAQGIKHDYVDNDGIKWVSFDVIHSGAKKWMEVTGLTDLKESPYFEADANTISWKSRVQMQSVIQKYIDHSISSTVNLPNNATQQEVSEIYLEGWKSGCKGITLYRDGCRKGVLSDDKTVTDAKARKRDKVLKCDIHYSNIFDPKSEKTNQWVFFVGIQDGVPYEIFGGKRDKIELPKKLTSAQIVKNGKDPKGRSTYDLVIGQGDDAIVIKNIAEVFTSNPGSYTRLISLPLRHHIPIKFICESLMKDAEAHMFSFEKGVARVLRKYVKDHEKLSDVCPKCNNPSLEYRSGCVYCVTPACGWSKCD